MAETSVTLPPPPSGVQWEENLPPPPPGVQFTPAPASQPVSPDNPFAPYAAALRQHHQDLEDERINREGPWNVGGFARQVGQGATLGFGDEIEAGARSLFGGQNYDEQLARIRQENEGFERRNPVTAFAGQALGAAPMAVLAPEARLAEALGYAGQAAAPARGLLNQSIRSSATGAAYGGAYGFGAGEGGVRNRLENAVSGAETGAELGFATPAALRAANIATGPIRNIGGAVNGRIMGTVPDDALIEALRRDGFTPEQALQRIQERRASGHFAGNSDTDLREMLADFGPNTQRLAQTITAEPGPAQTIGTEAVESRAGINRENIVPDITPADDIYDALVRALRIRSQPDLRTSVDSIVEEQRNLSNGAYNGVRANPTQFDVGPILERQQQQNADLVGPMRQAFDKAVSFFRQPMQTRVAARTADLQNGLVDRLSRRILPGTPERAIVEGLQADLTSGQLPAASMQRQARFQQAINDINSLVQNASPKNSVRLNALRDKVEDISNRAGRTQNIPWTSTQTTLGRFDQAKRALDDMIESATAQRDGTNLVRVLTGLKNDLVEHADLSTAATAGDRESSPYFQARRIYSSRAELLDAAEQGRAMLRPNAPPFTRDDFNAMSPAEQRLFRQGLAEEVYQMMTRKAYGEDVTRMFKIQHVQDVLAAAFPDTNMNTYGRFNSFVARKANQQRTLQMATRGSDTARIEAGKEDFKNLSVFGRAIRTVGPEGAIWVTVTEGLQHLTRMREADATRVARMLFNPDPAVVDRTLTMLQQRYGSNVAYRMRRMIEPRMRAAPGTTGAVAALQGSQQQ